MPTRKPTARQVIEGDKSKRGKRKLWEKLQSEPIAQKGLPACPAHLDGRARESWNFLRTEIELMQLDARPDAVALEAVCVAYARAVAADIRLNAEGTVIEEPVLYKGEALPGYSRKKKHPAVNVSFAAWAQVRAFCCEFGLTPVSRTRLTVERKEQDDADLNKLLSGPRLVREQ